jgi:site-specific DNA-methyltransferase (adenine-specific)
MIHHGPYSPALDGMTWDALICDPPYSARTHTGHDGGALSAERSAAWAVNAAKRGQRKWDTTYATKTVQAKGTHRRSLTYAPWTPDDVRQFVAWAAPRTRGWLVCMTDSDLANVYRDAMEAAGRLAFAPVSIIQPRPRLTGDGPGSWTIYLMVSRPRNVTYSRWGCLPGSYSSHAGGPNDNHIGGKPLSLMRRIVADYSRPGDVVCDPCAGWGTTLRAAQMEGRQWLGCDVDGEAVAAARARLAEPYEVPLIPYDPVQTRIRFDDDEPHDPPERYDHDEGDDGSIDFT